MQARLKSLYSSYPPQFWLMFSGMLISTIGSSMIWPFLMIYVTEKLNLPLTTSASLISLNALMGLISSLISGWIVDVFGRKWVMALSLGMNALGYFFLSQATTLPQFAVLMALQGAANPLYRVGADAMMADLICKEKRLEAYSLMRISNNAGISLGPAIGGFLASSSYTTAFYAATIGLSTYCALIVLFARETIGKARAEVEQAGAKIGQPVPYGHFLTFVFSFTLTTISTSIIWILMSVYSKQNYGIEERLYGFIPTTNAIMCVTLQYMVTRWTRNKPPLQMLALGSFFYASATLAIGFSTGFWGFWGSMVWMTIGELILTPTATNYVANMAPPDMRGRFMGIFGLSWPVASIIGPLFGGFLNDNVSPQAIWFGGAAMGTLGVLMFLLLSARKVRYAPA